MILHTGATNGLPRRAAHHEGLRNLAQLSSDALLVVAGGCIAYANPAANALMAPAVGVQDLHGLSADTLWQPNPLETIQADGQPLSPVVVGLKPDGTSYAALVLELTATCSQTPEGPVYYVRARRKQEPAAGLAARVRTALALSTDAAMVMDARTMRRLDANPAACDLMGMPLEALLTSSPAALRQRDGPASGDAQALYEQLIEHSPQAQSEECDVVIPDGRAVPMAVTRQALNVDGHWLIFITWHDISSRKQQEHHLQRVMAAVNAAVDAIYIIDPLTLAYKPVPPAKLRIVMKNLLST